jgi:hypothetical protein
MYAEVWAAELWATELWVALRPPKLRSELRSDPDQKRLGQPNDQEGS